MSSLHPDLKKLSSMAPDLPDMDKIFHLSPLELKAPVPGFILYKLIS